MKSTDKQNLHELAPNELQTKLQSLQQQAQEARLNKKPTINFRRQIAVIKTILGEHKL